MDFEVLKYSRKYFKREKAPGVAIKSEQKK